MSRPFFVIASILGFLGVAAGAFGSHLLSGRISQERFDIFETAVRYQMYHVFALVVSAWALEKYEQRHFVKAGWLFFLGVALFSGSLYILVLVEIQWLGLITPVGGFAFLAGWVFLATGFWKLK